MEYHRAGVVKIASKSEHIDYFDWLRALGCAAVVLLHVLSIYINKHSVAAHSVRMFWTCEADLILTRWAVPVFLMMSGALLLDARKTVDYRRALGYARRMAAVLATFGFAFCVMEAAYRGSQNPLALGLKNLVCGRSWTHMWYVYTMMGIYLLLPVFKAFADSASDRDYRTLLVVLFVLSCVVPSVNRVTGLSVESFVWLTSPCLYFFLGHYLHEHVLQAKRVAAVGLGAVLVAALLLGYGVVACHDVWKWVWTIDSPFIVGYSALVLVASRHVFGNSANRVLRSVSARSFGIYIVHPLFLNLLYKVAGWGHVPLAPILHEIVTFGIVFAASYLLSWVLSRIPLFAWMRF